MSDNPLFRPSTLPFEAPHFDLIKDEHFLPAFVEGMHIHLKEVEKIADNPEDPTFENTIVALEKTGELLGRVQSVFFNVTATDTTEDLQRIQAEIVPKLTEHSDKIALHSGLFDRINVLFENRHSLNLADDEMKLLEDKHRRFQRSGVLLDEPKKQRLREINKELSELKNQFQENLLALTKERAVLVSDASELDGLSEGKIQAAKELAVKSGFNNGFLINISNTTRIAVLESLKNRSLRERIWKASSYRGIGENGGIDNRPLILKLVQLRAERAELLGYKTYAHYALETETAETPEKALKMLGDLVVPVLRNSSNESVDIQKMLSNDGIEDNLQPWDWEFYAEKVRQEKYELDESEIAPYFELESVLHNGLFYTMHKQFGIKFKERFDIPVYHSDVRVFNVLDDDGTQIALFYADFFARPSKRGGAWMSSFVDQSHLLNQKPVIVNVLNIEKPVEGQPALLSFDNVVTLFHEMGHGVHGLFSDVRFPSQSGTSVPRDFVEFPSTFQEDWAIDPEILGNYARHFKTRDPLPKHLLENMIAARDFNQGFDTQEYLAAALLDLEWHLVNGENLPSDIQAFEEYALEKYGLNDPIIPPRYKSPFFAHIFAGGYSAHYYAYMWSEILAADAFAHFMESGGLTLKSGVTYREKVLSKGGTLQTMDMYQNFRGQAPEVKHLLKRRGLIV